MDSPKYSNEDKAQSSDIEYSSEKSIETPLVKDDLHRGLKARQITMIALGGGMFTVLD